MKVNLLCAVLKLYKANKEAVDESVFRVALSFVRVTLTPDGSKAQGESRGI